MKKRILSICLTLALCLGMLPVAALAAEGVPVYLALGDSITTGYAPPAEGEEESQTVGNPFANKVADELGYTLNKDCAQDGETSTSLLAKLDGTSTDTSVAAIEAALPDADLITITIGGNDLMEALYAHLAKQYNASKQEDEPELKPEDVKKALENLSVSENQTLLMSFIGNIGTFSGSEAEIEALNTFETNLSAIIDKIQDKSPNAKIVIATQYNPYGHINNVFTNSIVTTFEKGVGKLNEKITAVAEDQGILVANVYQEFVNNTTADTPLTNAYVTSIMPSFNANLDFHPNQAGHDLIAVTIMDKLFEDLDLTVGGIEVTRNNANDVLGVADGEGATVTCNIATNTLTLNNATITEGNYYGIKANGDLTIALVGESTVGSDDPESDYDSGIDISNGSLTITGPGSLKATSRVFCIDVIDDNMTVTGGATVTATSTGEDSGYGIRVYSGDLVVSGGSTVTGTGTTYGIISMDGSMTVIGSTVIGICRKGDRSYGILSGAVTLGENALVRGVVESGDWDGISASSITGTGSVFSNSPHSNTGTVYGNVTLQEDLEINEGETLTIGQDASLTVPNGKTLTNNGTIDNSGTVTTEKGGSLTNSGTVTTEKGGSLTNNGTIDNSGTVTTEEGGNLTNNGTIDNSGTMTGSITNAPPQITSQPTAQSVTEGDTASFTIVATGDTLSYQWQRLDGYFRRDRRHLYHSGHHSRHERRSIPLCGNGYRRQRHKQPRCSDG